MQFIAAGERYLDALRAKDAASRKAQLNYLTRQARQDATHFGHQNIQKFEAQQRCAASIATRPRHTIRPGLMPEERLWLHAVATMPYEFALMARYDPVVRSVGVAVAVVGSVKAAPSSTLPPKMPWWEG